MKKAKLKTKPNRMTFFFFYILSHCPRFVSAKSFPSRSETAVGDNGGVAADDWDRDGKSLLHRETYSTYKHILFCTLSSVRRFIFAPLSHRTKIYGIGVSAIHHPDGRNFKSHLQRYLSSNLTAHRRHNPITREFIIL